jgi:2-oxoglutarate dehydrogenase E1 component
MAMDALLNGSNLPFLEDLYAAWKENPASVDASWAQAFAELDRAPAADNAKPSQIFLGPSSERGKGQKRTDDLIHGFRLKGHLRANLDPLGLQKPPELPFLDYRTYGFGEPDLDRPFHLEAMPLAPNATLREILRLMEETYCRTIGVEYMHLHEQEPLVWLQERMEQSRNRTPFTAAQKREILTKLSYAEGFENFLQKKYVGVKRFSLSGSDSLIPMLAEMVETASERGVEEIVFGMAHRGRLNVLTNILHKTAANMFSEFEHNSDPWDSLGIGDVKYHLGFSSDHNSRSGKQIHLTMAFNPSHLEFVGAVVEGRVRAKQDRKDDEAGNKVVPVLMHGDAAFMGQGVVMETLNLAGLRGYSTGGTVHVVINNQVGFTTSPEDGRSTMYCTEIAKVLNAPILHVNADDAEACVHAMLLALDYRMKFHRDVVIDLVSYRRYGHNEGDEPSFTQPVMYDMIRSHESARALYVKQLAQEGALTAAEGQKIFDDIMSELNKEHETARSQPQKVIPTLTGVWQSFQGGEESATPEADTALKMSDIEQLTKIMSTVPQGFTLHPKLQRILDARGAMGRGEAPFDWATAELLAMSSLVAGTNHVRMSGQDSRRGTFSSRHAVVFDQKTGAMFSPLSTIPGGRFEIYDSPLSEQGVMGFEFGYSLDSPDALVVWEAQFGDFANVAQVIIDQFIASSAEKWKRLSGLVLMLPHGYEGQGAEHSSARLERFLQLSAMDNLQVCNLSTPAQIFHALRRQVLRPYRKPLILMTPKSLLRHPEAISSREELASGSFQRVIADTTAPAAKVRRVLLCTGKVYYDLIDERKKRGAEDVAVVRVEEMYPFPADKIKAALAPYRKIESLAWVQEEPANMGAATFMTPRLSGLSKEWPTLEVVARQPSACPATGSKDSHDLEQRLLVGSAFGDPPPDRKQTKHEAAASPVRAAS